MVAIIYRYLQYSSTAMSVTAALRVMAVRAVAFSCCR